MALRLPASRTASLAQRASSSAAPRLAVPVRIAGAAPRPGVRARATNEGQSSATDLDAFFSNLAQKFEKSENKPAIVGYSAAAVGAFFFSEWLIHLPGLDILLGFPVQLVGLLVLPFLVLRWGVDGKDAAADITDVVSAATKKLPGLDGKN